MLWLLRAQAASDIFLFARQRRQLGRCSCSRRAYFLMNKRTFVPFGQFDSLVWLTEYLTIYLRATARGSSLTIRRQNGRIRSSTYKGSAIWRMIWSLRFGKSVAHPARGERNGQCSGLPLVLTQGKFGSSLRESS